MVVKKDTPHGTASLTVGGAIRVQENGVSPTCAAGVVKSVKSTKNPGQLCPCFCDGTSWASMLDTPQCLNVCNDSKATSLTAACGKGDVLATGGSATLPTNKLTTLVGITTNGDNNKLLFSCNQGTILPYTSYVFSGETNIHYWSCVEPTTAKVETCKEEFKCQKSAPANAILCANDDRDLLNNTTDKKLVQTCGANKCEYICDASAGYEYKNGVCVGNGKCGSNPATVSSRPTGTNLCANGEAISLVETASGWTWQCKGFDGGTTSPTCSANCASTHKPSGTSCTEKSCSDGGYQNSVPANQTCSTVSYAGKTCYTNCSQPTCAQGGFQSSIPTNQTCTAVGYYGRTCYSNCSQPTCAQGGFQSSIPSGQTCTSVSYYGRACYKDCKTISGCPAQNVSISYTPWGRDYGAPV